MIGSKSINKLASTLEENLAKELRDQGHYLTGALEKSIQSKVRGSGGDISLEVVANDYIDDLETGIPGHQIDVNDASYIRGLAEYARLRFGLVSEREALRAAFRIAAKHRKEGMPTFNSYQFSHTGERTEAIQQSYERNERQVGQQLEDDLSAELDELIDQTFDQTQF